MADPFRDYRRKLQRLANVVDESVADGAIEAAEEIAQAARDLAPVRSGRLRDSIQTDVENRRRSQIDVAIGPDESVEYAADEEFGSDHNYAHPYMRPAVDTADQRAVDSVTKRARDGIRTVAK